MKGDRWVLEAERDSWGNRKGTSPRNWKGFIWDDRSLESCRGDQRGGRKDARCAFQISPSSSWLFEVYNAEAVCFHSCPVWFI